jgi:hypothetical protein
VLADQPVGAVIGEQFCLGAHEGPARSVPAVDLDARRENTERDLARLIDLQND